MSREGLSFEANSTASQDIVSTIKVGMEAGANFIDAIVTNFPPRSTRHNSLGKLATSPTNAVGIELHSAVAHVRLSPSPPSVHRRPDADLSFPSRPHVHPTARSSIFSADRQVSVPDGRITDGGPSGPRGWLGGGPWGNSRGLSSLSIRNDEQRRNGGSERPQPPHADNGENCQAWPW